MSVRNDSAKAVGMARSLRKRMTGPERALWRRLRCERLGFRFRRQYPAGKYILDFYCPEARLCVEVDGSSHELTITADAERDSWLKSKRIRVVRIDAYWIGKNLDGIVEGIWRTCAEQVGLELS